LLWTFFISTLQRSIRGNGNDAPAPTILNTWNLSGVGSVACWAPTKGGVRIAISATNVIIEVVLFIDNRYSRDYLRITIIVYIIYVISYFLYRSFYYSKIFANEKFIF
jgi:hypothetical protein